MKRKSSGHALALNANRGLRPSCATWSPHSYLPSGVEVWGTREILGRLRGWHNVGSGVELMDNCCHKVLCGWVHRHITCTVTCLR